MLDTIHDTLLSLLKRAYCSLRPLPMSGRTLLRRLGGPFHEPPVAEARGNERYEKRWKTWPTEKSLTTSLERTPLFGGSRYERLGLSQTRHARANRENSALINQLCYSAIVTSTRSRRICSFLSKSSAIILQFRNVFGNRKVKCFRSNPKFIAKVRIYYSAK